MADWDPIAISNLSALDIMMLALTAFTVLLFLTLLFKLLLPRRK